MIPDPAVDAYLDGLPDPQRTLLRGVRARIAELLPDAVEGISYGMPTFKLDGRPVVWIAGWKRHCSLYPLTADFAAAHGAELERFRGTKGSLHFTAEQPLPDELLVELVRARVRDIEAGGR